MDGVGDDEALGPVMLGVGSAETSGPFTMGAKTSGSFIAGASDEMGACALGVGSTNAGSSCVTAVAETGGACMVGVATTGGAAVDGASGIDDRASRTVEMGTTRAVEAGAGACDIVSGFEICASSVTKTGAFLAGAACSSEAGAGADGGGGGASLGRGASPPASSA